MDDPYLEVSLILSPLDVLYSVYLSIYQLGTLVGLSIGGPLTALILASLATYSTTTEGDWGEATR